MFLNLIKKFFLKKYIRNTSKQNQFSTNKVIVIINHDFVPNVDKIKKDLRDDVFQNLNITFIDFKSSLNKKELTNANIISEKSFNWKAQISSEWALPILKGNYFICAVISGQNNYINKLANDVQAQYKFEISDIRNDIFDVSLICSMHQNSDCIVQLKNYLKSFKLIN